MSQDFLLEIGLEEMPSAFMGQALQDLKEIAGNKLREQRIAFRQINTMGTPRRMVLYIEGLAEKQADAVIETKGPKKSSAYGPDGQPTKAAQGFARSQGLEVAELKVQAIDGVEYVFAVKSELGVETESLLPTIMLETIHGLSFPRSMRWGYFHTRFARPIRWLLALYGERVVEFQIENVTSSNLSMGHRFLAPEPFVVASPAQYFEAVRERYVIVDHQERKVLIWQQVQAVAAQAGGQAMENENLLDEVTFLVEYPTAFYAEFSTSYLDVPPEVLTTSMIAHQRYFPVFDPKHQLMPGFIGVRNGTDYCLEIVKSGNQRVLKARLEDALFFWKEDTGKGLDAMVPGLKDILFHEKLGSVLEKVDRLRSLAAYMGQELNLSSREKLERAAGLCKADLLSSMVFEFPELQGIMGRYYALRGGEDAEVAEAILEHYLPRFAGDTLPLTPTGVALSLAEKMSNLVAFFAIGIKPSGSQDPYALRRQALGVVNTILDMGLTLDLHKVIARAYEGLKAVKTTKSQADTIDELTDFILQRMRGVLLERGLSYDVIDAVLNQGGADLNQIRVRAEAVSSFKDDPRWDDFLVVFNRAHNLSKKWESAEVDLTVLIDDSEKSLYQHYQQLQPQFIKAVAEQDYLEAMALLAGIRVELDRFFEAVMVMVDEEQLKAARLGILKSIASLGLRVADFSKIVA